jgi:phosphoribosylformylglycinamidine synthase subunit PurS
MKAQVYVTFKPGVLDPQGQAVAHALQRLGFGEVQDARVGRYIEIELDGTEAPATLRGRVEQMCQRLLANPVIEDFRVELDPEGRGGPGAAR